VPLRPVKLRLEAVDRFSKPMNGMTAKMRAFKTPIRSLQRSFRGLSDESGLARLGSSIGTLTRRVALLGAAATALGVASFKGFLDDAGKLNDAAAKLGLPVERLQELLYAAEQSDVGASTLETSLARLQREMAKAGRKGPVLDVLLELDERLRGVSDAAQRTAIAQRLLGKGGSELLKLLGREGDDSLPALIRRYRELGVAIGGETGGAADTLGDRFVDLRLLLRGIRNTISAALLPDITRMAEGVLRWASANRELIRVKALEFAHQLIEAIRGLVRITTALAPIVERVTSLFGFWGTAAGVLGGVLGLQLLSVVANLAVAMKALGIGTTIALLPLVKFILIGAAVVGLAALIVKHWEPITGFFARIWEVVTSEFSKNVEFMKGLLGGLLEWIRSVFSTVGDLIPDFAKGGGLGGAFAGLGNLAPAGGAGPQSFGGHITVELAGPGAERARVRRLESSNELDLAVRSGRAHLGVG